MNKLLLILLAIFVISCGDKKEMENMEGMMEGDTPSTKIMNMMHMPMMEQEFQITENPDIDYLVNMIPHHQGAIDSSKEYIMVSTDENVKMLANQIIMDQEKEIAEFNMLLPELEAMNTDYSEIDYMAYGNQSEELMNAMMASMMGTTLAENPDLDFLMGMTPHHQGAIDASMKILEITKDEKIKTIANNIIAAQKKEIADMATMIENIKNK